MRQIFVLPDVSSASSMSVYITYVELTRPQITGKSLKFRYSVEYVLYLVNLVGKDLVKINFKLNILQVRSLDALITLFCSSFQAQILR